jgi:hypothetical protein
MGRMGSSAVFAYSWREDNSVCQPRNKHSGYRWLGVFVHPLLLNELDNTLLRPEKERGRYESTSSDSPYRCSMALGGCEKGTGAADGRQANATNSAHIGLFAVRQTR